MAASLGLSPLGAGLYTIADAARLLKISAPNIRRWLKGYSYKSKGVDIQIEPLWSPQFVTDDDGVELGFQDLIELRFIAAFTKAGLDLRVIRHCLLYARQCVKSDKPFLSGRFKTDGKTIFLAGVEKYGGESVLDLKSKQYEIKDIIAQTFKDLDIIDDVVRSWRPYGGKNTILIDPRFVFGQPMTAECHIPTIALAQAVEAEGSEEAVAAIYEIPVRYVRDAAGYERNLAA